MVGLSNRVHIFARPGVKQKLEWCFTTILGCGAGRSLDAPGFSEPILAFSFPNGGGLSVEFTEDALDDARARRGAWFELEADDPAALKKKVLEAGLPEVKYLGNDFFYFAAPGGQVLRIVPSRKS